MTIGWSTNLEHNPQRRSAKRHHLTLTDFYSYRLATRYHYDRNLNVINDWSSLHYAGKLFQQYILDAWIIIESNNLNYMQQNQPAFRVEMYSGLMDYVTNQAVANNVAPGKVFVLPSSFQVCVLIKSLYYPPI